MEKADRIAHANKLWAAWSSGNIHAPQPLVSEDFVLTDTGFGARFESWTEIAGFFGRALEKWPDLAMEPLSHWTSDDPDMLATLWRMTGTHAQTGKHFSVDGMSTLRFLGDKVVEEVDYYSGISVRASEAAD